MLVVSFPETVLVTSDYSVLFRARSLLREHKSNYWITDSGRQEDEPVEVSENEYFKKCDVPDGASGSFLLALYPNKFLTFLH